MKSFARRSQVRQCLVRRGIDPAFGAGDAGGDDSEWYLGFTLAQQTGDGPEALPHHAWAAPARDYANTTLIVHKLEDGRDDERLTARLAALRSSAFRTMSKLRQPRQLRLARPADVYAYGPAHAEGVHAVDPADPASGASRSAGAGPNAAADTALLEGDVRYQLGMLREACEDVHGMAHALGDRMTTDRAVACAVVAGAVDELVARDGEVRALVRALQSDNEKGQKRVRQLEDLLGDLRDIMDMQEDKLEVAAQRMQAFIERKPANPVTRLLWGLLRLFLAVLLSLAVLVLKAVRVLTDAVGAAMVRAGIRRPAALEDDRLQRTNTHILHLEEDLQRFARIAAQTDAAPALPSLPVCAAGVDCPSNPILPAFLLPLSHGPA
jgi:hypothetical protein